MMSIPNVDTGAAQPLTTAEKALGASKDQRPEEGAPKRKREPVMDGYVPERPREPSGRYWVGQDEDGRPKIYFDDPERAADTLEQPESAPEAEGPDPADRGAKGPEEKDGGDERWACDTGKADREIETLKKKRQELERKLDTETDEARIKELERQLAQVERELERKDSDTYRKQRSTYTRLS